MNQKTGFFSLLIFCSFTLLAQQPSVKKKSDLFKNYHSYNSIQLLTGSSSTSLSWHSVNGFSKGKFFGGIGTGMDYYYKTSVPLFAEARFDIAGVKRKLQLFANGGVHIPYGNINKKEPSKTDDFKTGRLLAAGFDYYVPVKKNAIVIGLAYSQKQLTQMVDYTTWNPVLNELENVPIKELYSFNRYWIKIGYVF